MKELVRVLWDMFGAEKTQRKDLSMPGQKRTIRVLPLIMIAFNNEMRRKILVFLLKNGDAKFSFKQIKEELSPIQNEPLSNHLQSLQKAWLIERTVDISDPEIQKNPYHSFYQISNFGFKTLNWLTDFFLIVEEDYLSKR